MSIRVAIGGKGSKGEEYDRPTARGALAIALWFQPDVLIPLKMAATAAKCPRIQNLGIGVTFGDVGNENG